MKSLCVYEWKSWDGFLLPMIFPGATRLRARPGESAAELLQRLPSHTRTFAYHVNLTDTRRSPRRRSAFSRALRTRGIQVLNEHVTDISKRRVQEVCEQAGLHTVTALRSGDPDERVIVKTNANYGGEKEKFLSPLERQSLGLGPRCPWIRRHDGYLILPRREVPREYWRSRHMVVERFIENRHHIFYRAHQVGDRMIVSRMVNPAGIKKMLQQIRRTNWYLHLPSLEPVHGPKPVPAGVIRSVSRFCEVLKLDVGSIDVLVDDEGECYIIDVNSSPYWGETGYDHMLRFLGGGLISSGAESRSSSATR